MSDLYKTERMTIRWSAEQLARIERAAEIQSRRKGELIEPGTLVRDLTMPGVDEILASVEATAGN
jgi:hypothetical protein